MSAHRKRVDDIGAKRVGKFLRSAQIFAPVQRGTTAQISLARRTTPMLRNESRTYIGSITNICEILWCQQYLTGCAAAGRSLFMVPLPDALFVNRRGLQRYQSARVMTPVTNRTKCCVVEHGRDCL
ncbi:hypothetical protein Bcep1808_7383 (plasmid) [Burkholderia vietnamiensis G4]|uniref:Uncharacterized protein n=1 Tax=Burkholderia vietnamiensis (strain G4 / LMG 22486) TaxID=269482 RepID=A4JVF7_BURVG|nr:hypothetical protein Bcep1808_7383 [Burkholderia vietnamiensis G4]